MSSRSWNAWPSGRPIAESGGPSVVEPARERGAEVQRPFDGVLARLERRDAVRERGLGARGRGADEVERLADAQLDAQLVEDVAGERGRVAHQHVGVHDREVADEDRHALAEAARFAAPAARRRGAARSARCTASLPAPRVGAVHHVVVHERERVHQLERGRGVDHGGSSGRRRAPTNAQ